MTQDTYTPENTRKNNILMIASQPFFEKRGSPIRLFFNLVALREMKYDVTFFCLPYGEPKNIPGVKIIRAWKVLFWIKHVSIGPSFTKFFYDCVLLIQTTLFLLNNKVDVVHTVEDTGLVGSVLKYFFGISHVYEKHSDINSYAAKGTKKWILKLYQLIEIRVIKNADQVIGTGTALSEFIGEYKTDPTRVHNIYDMPTSFKEPDPVNVKTLRHAWTGGKSSTVLLYVGSFAIYQGLDILLSSLEFMDTHDLISLMIIGGTPQEISLKKEFLKTMTVPENTRVSFLGQIEPNQLPDYLAASDILVSPRIQGKNSPLKILDYLKSGKTLLVSDHESHRQLLSSKEAYFYQPDSSPELATAIHTLCCDNALRWQLSQKSRALFEKKFTFSMFKQRLKNCYNRFGTLIPISSISSNESLDELVNALMYL